MPDKRRVLIVCTGNCCRSQMAEGLWRAHGGERWEVFSAGSRPAGFVYPLAVRAMREAGIDISGHRSKSVDEFRDDAMDLVVTVCDSAAQDCPTFPNAARTRHWPFDDPTPTPGTDDERMAAFRRVRDEIEARIRDYLREADGASAS